MSEYVFRYASGYGCDMGALMDGGRVTVGEYFASDATDHYGTLHEEIVRCRDCKWFTPEYFYEEERGYGVKEILSDPPDCGNPERCSNHYDSLTKKTVPVHIVTDPDGFCAWGVKRKEGGE